MPARLVQTVRQFLQRVYDTLIYIRHASGVKEYKSSWSYESNLGMDVWRDGEVQI